jgi:hypothetical protein
MIKHSSLQRVVLWFACSLFVVTLGCQRRDEKIGGVDIPIPEKMTKNNDTGFVPIKGFEDGQVSYQGNITPAQIFSFYQEVMAAKGWQPNSWFADQKDRIAYTKGNRVVLIRSTPNPDGTTVLTVMVGTQYPPK